MDTSNAQQNNKRIRSPGETSSQPSKMLRGAGSRNHSNAVELGHAAASNASTKKDLADIVARIKPKDADITEVLKTRDGRILIFGKTPRDYNTLLLSDRWSNLEGAVSTKIAPRTQGGKAVVIQQVDHDIDQEEILEELRKQGFSPSLGTRLKRTSDGQPTKSVKIFIEDESQIQKLTEDGFYLHWTHYRVNRYTPNRFQQCYRCQSLSHLANACPSDVRVCLRCSQDHHHRECLIQPAEYRCANCSGCHAANDIRCEKIKEIVNRTSGQGNSSSTQPTAPPAPPTTNAWSNNFPTLATTSLASTSNQTGDLKSIVAEAVGDAVKKELGNFGAELAKTFASEFKDTMSEMLNDFRASIKRYEEEISCLEEIITKQSMSNNGNNITPTSPSGAVRDLASQSKTGPTIQWSAIPEVVVSTEEVSIILPPTRISLVRGQQSLNIDKIIKQQIKSNDRIVEREIEKIKDEIKTKYLPLAAKPRRRLPKNLIAAAAEATTDSEPETPTQKKRTLRKVSSKIKSTPRTLPRLTLQSSFPPSPLPPHLLRMTLPPQPQMQPLRALHLDSADPTTPPPPTQTPTTSTSQSITTSQKVPEKPTPPRGKLTTVEPPVSNAR